jgi:hypothetical protein
MFQSFSSKYSFESYLVEFIDSNTKTMEAGKQADVLIMDYFKAFDKVSHNWKTIKSQQLDI